MKNDENNIFYVILAKYVVIFVMPGYEVCHGTPQIAPQFCYNPPRL